MSRTLRLLRAVLSVVCFMTLVHIVLCQDKTPRATAKGEAPKTTELSKEQKAEMAGLLIDLQNAQLAKVNLEKAVEKAKSEADKAIVDASNAYVKRLEELRKEHNAANKNLDLRQQWQDPPKQP